MRDKVTIPSLKRAKERGEKIVMVTCYDYAMAKLLDEAGVDVLLIGDSVGNNVLGYDSTIPVVLDDMVRHTAAVQRGTQHALVLADMPFLSYGVSEEEAVRNAGRLIQEGGAEAVKLEGGARFAPMIEHMISVGIPVIGHLGLTPQSINVFGGYRVQGRDDSGAQRLKADAMALATAGVGAVVLELVEPNLAGEISASLPVPTIGIGSGPHCDGQVQVLHDLLGLFPDAHFRHSVRYAEVGRAVQAAVRQYAEDVRSGGFPPKAN